MDLNLTNYEDLYNLAVKSGCKVLKDELLSKHTTFKIGGPADLFIKVFNIDSLKQIVEYISKYNIPFFIIGNGSNLLVSDLGFRGAVLKLEGDFEQVKLLSDTEILCGGGAPLAKVCMFALENSLSGLEFAWGIPAVCGGATFMNAGAYGEDMSFLLQKSTHLTPDGKTQTISKEEMNLSYRKSLYSNNDYIIMSVILKLSLGDKNEIKKKMDENIAKRKFKQPLDYPNCGSVFKRPGGGYYAAALIEQCGLKGVSVGGACVSEKHSGFIINTGNATCNDVVKLIDIIKDKVYKCSGVNLEREVEMVGER